MSCNCGESNCNCSERCFCSPETCLCTVCFNLKETVTVKSEEENVPLESKPDISKIFIKSESEDIEEAKYSSYKNLENNVILMKPDKIKLEVEKEISSDVYIPEITLSDSEYETELKQQDCFKIAECSFKKEDSSLKIKSDKPDTSKIFIKSDINNVENNSNSSEDDAETKLSSFENSGSTVSLMQPDKIKPEVKRENSSEVYIPEITLSDNEYETVLKQQGSSKIADCSFKMEDNSLKIKSNKPVIGLKPCQKQKDYKRYPYKRSFEFFSNKTTYFKQTRRNTSWNKHRYDKNHYGWFTRKPNYSQTRKQPVLIKQHHVVKWKIEPNKVEMKVDVDKPPKVNTGFGGNSSSYSDRDIEENKNIKQLTTSNQISSSNIVGSFSEPESSGCDLSPTEPCSRCKRKRIMWSKYEKNKKMFMEAARISKSLKEPSTSFQKQNNQMLPTKYEIKVKKDDSIESSSLQGNRPTDPRDLTVYDFDELENEINSSDDSSFRKRSVKIDNSGRLKIVFPSVSQSSCSERSIKNESMSNVDSDDEMSCKATKKNECASFPNTNNSEDTQNDCVIVHESMNRIRRNTVRKIVRRRKYRKIFNCKRAESYIERNIKKQVKIKKEIKNEEGFKGKEISFTKTVIKKNVP